MTGSGALAAGWLLVLTTAALAAGGALLGGLVDARFLGGLPRRSAQSGAAVILIDHVTKDRESRGRFEGNTLVVETTNFNDHTSGIQVNGGGRVSTALKVTEHITRVAPNSSTMVSNVVACVVNASRLALGTARTKPSM